MFARKKIIVIPLYRDTNNINHFENINIFIELIFTRFSLIKNDIIFSPNMINRIDKITSKVMIIVISSAINLFLKNPISFLTWYDASKASNKE